MSKPNIPDMVTYQGKEYQIKYRYERSKDATTGVVKSSGGKTIAYLEDFNPENKERTILATASSRCSRKDNFHKKLGRHIAAGRLVKALVPQ